MEEDLLAFLDALPAITDLVGDRISWGKRGDGEPLPAIVLHNISSPRDYTLQARVRLVRHLVQVDCWGSTFDAAKLLSRAVIAALDGLRDAPFSGAFIEADESDSWLSDGPDAAGSTDIFRSRLDVRVCHTAA